MLPSLEGRPGGLLLLVHGVPVSPGYTHYYYWLASLGYSGSQNELYLKHLNRSPGQGIA